jgi:hypothetical protein
MVGTTAVATLLLPLLIGAPAAPYLPGERVDLDVDYLGVPIGKASLAVGQPAGPALPVTLQARTSGLMRLFDIREQLTTALDLATGLPRWSTLEAVEPRYRHSDRADFDREAGQARVREIGNRDKTTLVPIPAGTLDFLALLFALRRLPLPPGQRHPFTILAGTTVIPVVAEVVGREVLRTDAGRFLTVKVRVPTGFTGKFSEKSPSMVWFSDDDRRIVVRIVTEFRIGRATAEITRYLPGQAAPADPPTSDPGGRSPPP